MITLFAKKQMQATDLKNLYKYKNYKYLKPNLLLVLERFLERLAFQDALKAVFYELGILLIRPRSHGCGQRLYFGDSK